MCGRKKEKFIEGDKYEIKKRENPVERENISII